MARFVDLDEGDEEHGVHGPLLRQHIPNGFAGQTVRCQSEKKDIQAEDKDGQDPSLKSSAVIEAFQCYPIVVAIASSIDLNTLDALSRTSRRIYAGLIQHRQVLLASTLRCSTEALPPAEQGQQTVRYRAARAGDWRYMEDGRNASGRKAGSCARDMVGECRRCSEVVCRNCAIKPPAPITLRERHRRLCVACVRAPIATLAKPPLDAHLPLPSEPVQRALCKCDTEGVWLCQPCGRTIRSADHEYQCIWRWRNQYGEVLGGLGTGIGDGDRGVICGREADCLRARDREQEIDCDAEDARDSSTATWTADLPLGTVASTTDPNPNTDTDTNATPITNTNTTANDSTQTPNDPIDGPHDAHTHTHSQHQLGPGYARHEIEGIGGIVKRKLVRMVRVGACVPEWRDEKGVGKTVLRREVGGHVRSWCGWCWRVVPGTEDVETDGHVQDKKEAGEGLSLLSAT